MPKLNEFFKEKQDQLIYLTFFVVVFVICLQVTLREGSDDTVYQTHMKTMSALEWVYFRATTWQPRITGDLSLALVGFRMPLWSFLCAALMTASIYFIKRMCILKNSCSQEMRTGSSILLCCAVFFIYPYVLTSGVFWYTGSFSYLWPGAAMLGALVPFCEVMNGRKSWTKQSLAVFFLCGIYASYVEQTVAVLLCFGAVTFIYLGIKRYAIPHSIVFLYLAILLNSAFFVMISKLGNREIKELHWYPNYEMLSLVDKVFQGVNVTNSHYINSSNLLFLLLCGLLAYIVYKRHKGYTRFLGFIPMIYLIGNLIPFDGLLQSFGMNGKIATEVTAERNAYQINRVLDRVFYNSNFPNPGNLFTELNGLLPSIFSLVMILFICVLLWLSFVELGDRIATCTLYIGGLASSYVVGLSPTIFASGSRIFYIGNILMLFVIGKLFFQLEESNFFKKNSRYVFCGLIGLAGVLALTFMTSFARGVLWL